MRDAMFNEMGEEDDKSPDSDLLEKFFEGKSISFLFLYKRIVLTLLFLIINN